MKKARRETSRLGDVDCNENRPRARIEFAKPIQNELTRNLIESRPSRAQTNQQGERVGLNSEGVTSVSIRAFYYSSLDGLQAFCCVNAVNYFKQRVLLVFFVL